MPAPVIDAARWLDGATFADIVRLVDRMTDRIARDEPPLPFRPDVRIAGALVKAIGPAGTARDIRARAVLAQDCVIELVNFPAFFDDNGRLKDELGEFRTVMLGVLAHEASHLLQWTVGRDASAHLAASDASIKARTSKDYEDYIDYLATPLELAAHSTQLAVEIWAAEGDGLGHADFEAAALRCGLWTHMTDHPDARPSSPEAADDASAATSMMRSPAGARPRGSSGPSARRRPRSPGAGDESSHHAGESGDPARRGSPGGRHAPPTGQQDGRRRATADGPSFSEPVRQLTGKRQALDCAQKLHWKHRLLGGQWRDAPKGPEP